MDFKHVKFKKQFCDIKDCPSYPVSRCSKHFHLKLKKMGITVVVNFPLTELSIVCKFVKEPITMTTAENSVVHWQALNFCNKGLTEERIWREIEEVIYSYDEALYKTFMGLNK